MRGQNNIQGAGDCGAVPNNFPGFQPVDDPADPGEVREGLRAPRSTSEAGITKVTALDRCGERHPRDADRRREHRRLRPRPAPLRARAEEPRPPGRDRHLPHRDRRSWPTSSSRPPAWGETDGVQTNTERRVQRLRAAVPPPGEAKPDWWIVSEIAKRLGIPGFEYRVRRRTSSTSSAALSPDLRRPRLGPHRGRRVPVAGARTRTTRARRCLHEREFKNGRGIFKIIGYRDPAEVIDDEYPGLADHRPPPAVLPHPHADRPHRRASTTCCPRRRSRSTPTTSTAWGLARRRHRAR